MEQSEIQALPDGSEMACDDCKRPIGPTLEEFVLYFDCDRCPACAEEWKRFMEDSQVREDRALRLAEPAYA